MGIFWERGRLARRFWPLAENIPSESSRRDADCGDRDGRAPPSTSARSRRENSRCFLQSAYSVVSQKIDESYVNILAARRLMAMNRKSHGRAGFEQRQGGRIYFQRNVGRREASLR
jgi:hypothetical protein